MMNSKKPVIFVTFLVVPIVCAIFIFELTHRARWGHFVSYGVHLDVELGDSDIDKNDVMYANLTNVSLRSLQLQGAAFPNDISVERELFHCWVVQRWDGTAWRSWDFRMGEWTNVRVPCDFTGAVRLSTRAVRPFQSVRHLAWMHKDFAKPDDVLRMVVRQSSAPEAAEFDSPTFHVPR